MNYLLSSQLSLESPSDDLIIWFKFVQPEKLLEVAGLEFDIPDLGSYGIIDSVMSEERSNFIHLSDYSHLPCLFVFYEYT